MSIAWSTIFPNGHDKIPNEEGLRFYDKVFAELKKYHIKLIITIFHYEAPFALIEKFNGWTSREAIDCYMSYYETIFKRYKDVVKYWITFNEINSLLVPAGALLIDSSFFKALFREEKNITIHMAKGDEEILKKVVLIFIRSVIISPM